MTRKSKLSFFVAFFMALFLWLTSFGHTNVYAKSPQFLDFITISDSSKTLKIGDQFELKYLNFTGNKVSFKSTNSSVASVSNRGLVTGKKAGACRIVVKAGSVETSCHVTVRKTVVLLSYSSAKMENDKALQLYAYSSTNHTVTWKSSKPSVASVDNNGLVVSRKVGFTTISATVDGTTKYCSITVMPPTIKLSHNSKNLYRTYRFKLGAKVSSGKKPVFKSSRSSVAFVDSDGVVTAVKHGTAIISATVDGVTASCIVYVKQPTIKINPSSLTICVGQHLKLQAKVSSGVKPSWTSSNINVVSVDSNGKITARQPGKAYIYAKEDGVKASCIVTVAK